MTASEYRGFGQHIVEELGNTRAFPVWNGLTDNFTHTDLADLMTMLEHAPGKTLASELRLRGDARSNIGSTMVGAAKMGMDIIRLTSAVLLATMPAGRAVPEIASVTALVSHNGEALKTALNCGFPLYRRTGLDGEAKLGGNASV